MDYHRTDVDAYTPFGPNAPNRSGPQPFAATAFVPLLRLDAVAFVTGLPDITVYDRFRVFDLRSTCAIYVLAALIQCLHLTHCSH